MEEVQNSLKVFQERADQEGKSKVRQCLEKISSAVLYYHGPLDVLAQQHPEYLSLVWGMLKFILMVSSSMRKRVMRCTQKIPQVIANNAEIVSELTKAMVDIAEVLPRAKLNAELYQTHHIKAAISALYARILLFFRQLISWYNLPRARKLASVIFKPFKLELKNAVDEVKRCAMVLDAAANVAHKAETRSMHVSVQELFLELKTMRTRFDSLDRKLDMAICKSHLRRISFAMSLS